MTSFSESILLCCRHVFREEPIDLLNVAFEQRVKHTGARQHEYVLQMCNVYEYLSDDKWKNAYIAV